MLINVFHDLRRLFPDRRGRSRLDQKRQNADAEPCGIEPAPRIFPRRRKLRQVVGCVQRCSSFFFSRCKKQTPSTGVCSQQDSVLYAFEHLQYSISGFAPKEQKCASTRLILCQARLRKEDYSVIGLLTETNIMIILYKSITSTLGLCTFF